MENRTKHTCWSLLLAAVLVLNTGCDEAVEPVLGTDKAFTLYGIFNPVSDVQAIRIYPIENRLEATRPEPLDVLAFSTNLTTGERVAWQDSIVQYPSGGYGHVLVSEFRAEYVHRYRLEVERPDGVKTTVETQVPPLSEAIVGEADPALWDLIIPVLWTDAPNLINTTVRYSTSIGTYIMHYGIEWEAVEGGLQVNVRFEADSRLIFADARLRGESSVRLFALTMETDVTNEEWVPPGGVFDANAFVEPGTFSNVENGFGFVGAGYTATVRWTPSDEVLRAAGFTVL